MTKGKGGSSGGSQGSKGGQAGSGGGSTKMDSSAASRIQSTSDKNPSSASATSGFKERAQSSAAQNEQSKS